MYLLDVQHLLQRIQGLARPAHEPVDSHLVKGRGLLTRKLPTRLENNCTCLAILALDLLASAY